MQAELDFNSRYKPARDDSHLNTSAGLSCMLMTAANKAATLHVLPAAPADLSAAQVKKKRGRVKPASLTSCDTRIRRQSRRDVSSDPEKPPSIVPPEHHFSCLGGSPAIVGGARSGCGGDSRRQEVRAAARVYKQVALCLRALRFHREAIWRHNHFDKAIQRSYALLTVRRRGSLRRSSPPPQPVAAPRVLKMQPGQNVKHHTYLYITL